MSRVLITAEVEFICGEKTFKVLQKLIPWYVVYMLAYLWEDQTDVISALDSRVIIT